MKLRISRERPGAVQGGALPEGGDPVRRDRRRDDHHDHPCQHDEEDRGGEHLKDRRAHRDEGYVGCVAPRRLERRGRRDGENPRQSEHDQRDHDACQDQSPDKGHGNVKTGHRACDGQAVRSVTNQLLGGQVPVDT